VRRHDEICPDEAASGRQQPTDQCCRDGKGRVGHDPERPAGESQVIRVGENDDDAVGLEAAAQICGAFVVQFDRHDTGTGVDECHREGTAAGSDIEHELAGSDDGLLHEERRPPAIELVEPPPLALPPGHGGP
jgi:hypothetical protein